MSTIDLTIDGQQVSVEPGTTLMAAATELGITIPGLCHLEGHPRYGSCLVCVVEEIESGRMLPSCATRAEQGMAVATGGDAVHDARRAALELLLSEHVGDCEAPCQMACPVGVDIARIMRHLERSEVVEASAALHDRLAIPALICPLCPAPCESACRRKRLDQAITIRDLHQAVKDRDGGTVLTSSPATGKQVAVVGSGPTGLAAAAHLIRLGHRCTIFEADREAGGSLLESVADGSLSRAILEAELEALRSAGVEIVVNAEIGTTVEWHSLRVRFDAVVLATGSSPSRLPEDSGIDLRGDRIDTLELTHETSRRGVFAGGSAVRELRTIAHAAAHALTMTAAVDQFLRGGPVSGPRRRFRSRVGRLTPVELQGLAVTTAAPGAGAREGQANRDAALEEAARCLQCSCMAANDCLLRLYAEDYAADASKWRGEDRRSVQRSARDGAVVHEPGKCIRCGRCVRLSGVENAVAGMGFIGRGYEMEVAPPYSNTVDEALGDTVARCVDACPTGALGSAHPKEGEEP